MTKKKVTILPLFFTLCLRVTLSYSETVCHDAVVPDFKPRGVNHVSQNSKEPLFELTVKPVENSVISQVYEVQIQIDKDDYAFTDATLAISANEKCGMGNLMFEANDFFEVQQKASCPRLLLTNRKSAMTRLPSLLWKPPPCGCVHFRVVLVMAAGSYYYAENADVTMGPLAKRICIPDISMEITKEQRLEGLCYVSEKYTGREILNSAAFQKRHQLDIHYTDRLELEMAIELRRADARMCCTKPTKIDREQCFQDARYRRADRFCQDGYPDIPFVSFRSKFMRSKERRCCSILGTYRYLCFAKDNHRLAGSDVTPMDFSLDATDPINDLAEFGTLEDFKDLLAKLQNTSKSEITQKKYLLDRVQQVGTDKNMKKLLSNYESVKGTISTKSPKLYAPMPKSNSTQSETQQKFTKESKSSEKSSPSTLSGLITTLPTSQKQNLINEKPQVPQLIRETPDIYRRLPSNVEPRRSSRTSTERRRNRRKNGGRSGRFGSSRRSGERKSHGQTSAQRRSRKLKTDRSVSPSDHRQGFSRSSSGERKIRRRTSAEKIEVLGIPIDNIEDQGGSSVEDTLTHIGRKMKRLELRRLCCQSGAISGSRVYGSLARVMEECKHSSYKYLQRKEISFGIKKCHQQFIKCCVDEAKMGLTMSSTEFRNRNYNYKENGQRTSLMDNDELLSSRGVSRSKSSKNVKGSLDTWQIMEAESDRLFDSMRAEVGDPRFGVGEGMDEEDEYAGPRRFDDVDNKNNKNVYGDGDSEVMNRKESFTRKASSLPQHKSSGLKNDSVDEPAMAKTEMDNKTVTEKKIKVEEKVVDNKTGDIETGNATHIVMQTEWEFVKEQFPQTDLLSESDRNVRRRKQQRRVEKADRSQKETSRWLKNPPRLDAGYSDTDETSRRIESRMSRRQDGRVSQRRRPRQRYSLNKKNRRHRSREESHTHKSQKKAAAMDSNEMAAAYKKHVNGALDSREMAAVFSQRNKKSSQRHKVVENLRGGGLSRRRRRHRKKHKRN